MAPPNCRCVGGRMLAQKGGHATCEVQPRMRGRAHRQTTRHTTRCGALGRIARRRSAPSGVVGFRQRRAGCPKLQIFGAVWGPFGAAPTRTGDIRTAKTAMMRGGWAHELAPRPHKVAHARTWRLGTVGAWGGACLHQVQPRGGMRHVKCNGACVVGPTGTPRGTPPAVVL